MKKRLTALATVTAALLVPATPALAQQNNPIPAGVIALMETQNDLHRIADKIEKSGGFSGFHVDAGTKTLNVHWKGKAPATVDAAATAAKAQGLTVKVHQAKYSKAELDAEATRLVKTGAFQAVAAKHDGSGLTVTGKSGAARTTAQSTVAVQTQSGGWELAASRLSDTAPFKGGAYVENYVTGQPQGACTTGFAMISNATNAPKLLTAAHCGDLGSGYSTGSEDPVGYVESRSVPSDSAIIHVTGAQPKVWIGDSVQTELTQPTANQYGLDVIGATTTLPGDWLCTSGAFSGTICEIQAVTTGMTVCFTPTECVYNLVEALHRGGYSAGGNGDSGGPVFSAHPGDQLMARGTLTAISTNPADVRQCSGVPAGNGRQCSQRIVFPDITTQTAQHGVRVMTTQAQ
ncbi:hypothetical protein SAMN05216553_111248 [Lentzea fradiae]|uniref:Streptogrisin C n=1 Tax=Lentzea fradiae TaxID=200378 RepID=A0A1G7X3Y8_9PSEU|nr:hypothetical protein [Lentzea fradiae]SDG78882.1 hypothetical protein SAMN05216553_111248 [Lentzea fradiae]